MRIRHAGRVGPSRRLPSWGVGVLDVFPYFSLVRERCTGAGLGGSVLASSGVFVVHCAL